MTADPCEAEIGDVSVIAAVLEQFDRVDFGRWRLQLNAVTIVSPLTTEEVAGAVWRALNVLSRGAAFAVWVKALEEDRDA